MIRPAKRETWSGETFLRISRALVALASFAAGPILYAQKVEPLERLYNHSSVEVEKALQEMKAYDTNRLPLLEGFVSANAGTLSKFENPHYQFRIDVFAQGSSQALVQVSAKITAWYADENPGRAQYVAIPSNGRLEADLLDRLNIFLERQSPRAAAGLSDATSARGNGAGSGSAPPNTEPSSLASQIVAAQAQREAVEENERKLEQKISELQANSRSQRYVSNLAIVKASQTPVFEQPQETSRVLFRADPEDEFEAVESREAWVQVRLENSERAWIRTSQLQSRAEVDDPEDFGAANFTTPKQSVKPFEGDWAPLRGKAALFVFAQPAKSIPDNLLGQAQMEFTKHVFIEGFRAAAHSQISVEGVVVIFFGPKGGVAAATLGDIHRWRDGVLPEKQFLGRCSFDPPESFRDTSKR